MTMKWACSAAVLLGGDVVFGHQTSTMMSSPTHPAVPCLDLELGTPPINTDDTVPSDREYDAALMGLDIAAVKADLEKLFTDSQDCWPADFGHYGPLFVRLAWHCSGSYRTSDGSGGCSGGRQRFSPEASWPDNTNLDKARALLGRIKRKYGDALSWGDLFTFAGTTALRNMGTPIRQWCAGRIDDADNTKSLALGPSNEQEQNFPCMQDGKNVINGKCQKPLGSTTVGLIYLNPEGPVDDEGNPQPVPAMSAKDVRDSFKRMDHDDRATVALIGGGHAFGKGHGACSIKDGSGYPPNVIYQDPDRKAKGEIPWAGKCGDGKGNNTVTAGFEGPWTTKPLKWDNEYYKNLMSLTWEKFMGPGGHWQWRVKEPATKEQGDLMRLTSDMALLADENYAKIVLEFAQNLTALESAFDDAWSKLITKGGRWSPQRKCDSGDFPEHLLDHKGMKATDVIV